ncbi:glyoxylase-like metal-dependent hydrolase (beta-lactamase superfamily II) [Methanococcus voltae]|uniref:MBL fold metallo-hydrolase n=1 Tax=Methanococcus voltae TaxID=2188 RepID=UPI001AE93CC5|nr:MBL fold metallo-hydrolase [Methanococcus voltae]MBP2143852.1 glyoxylase-like metal-dependent hydrolase (beta-lactamase superfamily II) [Methanococcus voltae]
MIVRLNGIGYDSNSYLIVDKLSILVDPGTPSNFENLRQEISKYTNKIDYIVNTHCHYDHAGSDYLFEEAYNAPVIIGPKDLLHLKNVDTVTVSRLFGVDMVPPKNILVINEVEEQLKEANIEFIETPGHTEGGLSLIYGDNLITGDTLFAYGVGRHDLPTGNIAELRDSINKLERVAYSKKIVNILPGHGETGDMSAFANATMFI